MNITIDIAKKYIDIWFCHEDEEFSARELQNTLKGYQINVFHSGNGDLAALTSELLRINSMNA